MDNYNLYITNCRIYFNNYFKVVYQMYEKLTIAQIEHILSKKKYAKAKRIAVENFLMTSTTRLAYPYAIMNLNYDRKVYNWNSQTYNAINEGVLLLYKNKKVD